MELDSDCLFGTLKFFFYNFPSIFGLFDTKNSRKNWLASTLLDVSKCCGISPYVLFVLHVTVLESNMKNSQILVVQHIHLQQHPINFKREKGWKTLFLNKISSTLPLAPNKFGIWAFPKHPQNGIKYLAYFIFVYSQSSSNI